MGNNSNVNEPKPPAGLNRPPHHHYLHVYAALCIPCQYLEKSK